MTSAVCASFSSFSYLVMFDLHSAIALRASAFAVLGAVVGAAVVATTVQSMFAATRTCSSVPQWLRSSHTKPGSLCVDDVL